jgi:hypothetical protein
MFLQRVEHDYIINKSREGFSTHSIIFLELSSAFAVLAAVPKPTPCQNLLIVLLQHSKS